MEKRETFSARLKEALKIRHLTKADLSRMTGISKSSLTHYEKGDWEGKQDAVYKISKALNVPEAWLMGFEAATPFEKDADQEDISIKEKQPLQPDGLSEEALMIAKIVDALPPERRQLLLALVQELASAPAGQDVPPKSPK